MSDYLMKGGGVHANAINMPSITAEEAPRLKPFIKLAEVLGSFVGQVTPKRPNPGSRDPVWTAPPPRPPHEHPREPLISAATQVCPALIRPQVADGQHGLGPPIMAKERGGAIIPLGGQAGQVGRSSTGLNIRLTVKTAEQPHATPSPEPVSRMASPASSRSRASISMRR